MAGKSKKNKVQFNPYFCEICMRRYTKKGHLNRHLKIHSGQKTFVCNICNAGFVRRDSLVTHKVVHLDDDSFLYKDTGKRTNRSVSPSSAESSIKSDPTCLEDCNIKIELHSLDESGNTNEPCSLDGRSNTQLPSLVRSENSISSSNDINQSLNQIFIKEENDDESDEMFETLAKIKQEPEESSYPEPYVEVQLNFDSKNTSTDKEKLIKKKKIRKCNQVYLCDNCNYTCKRKDNLQEHIKSQHIKEIVFKCTLCSFKSTVESEAQNHIRDIDSICNNYIPEEEIARPLKCKLCDARFSRASGLSTHQRVHSDKQRYACNFCHYRSAYKANLRRHAIRHFAP